MQGNAPRDTKPELAVRRVVHGLGLRYRVDARPIAGLRRRADLLFTRAKVAVYVDGCFWHGCATHYKAPGGPNAEYWAAKVLRNQQRDRETTQALREAGWIVVRIWEHEDPAEAAVRVVAAVKPPAKPAVTRRES